MLSQQGFHRLNPQKSKNTIGENLPAVRQARCPKEPVILTNQTFNLKLSTLFTFYFKNESLGFGKLLNLFIRRACLTAGRV